LCKSILCDKLDLFEVTCFIISEAI
jgi:hypothetical protein